MTALSVAAYRYLINHVTVQQLASQGLIGSDTEYPRWVFRSERGDPSRPIEGSGKGCIILSQSSPWAIQNSHNTAQFPTLRVLIIADNTRDVTGTSLKNDAADKCLQIYNVVNPLFHDPGKKIDRFGDFRIHDIVAGSAFSVDEVPDSGGETFYGQIMYNITCD